MLFPSLLCSVINTLLYFFTIPTLLFHLPERASHPSHKAPLALHIGFQIFRALLICFTAIDGFHSFLILRQNTVSSKAILPVSICSFVWFSILSDYIWKISLLLLGHSTETRAGLYFSVCVHQIPLDNISQCQSMFHSRRHQGRQSHGLYKLNPLPVISLQYKMLFYGFNGVHNAHSGNLS